MLIYTHKVLSTVVTGSAFEYSSPDLYRELGRATTIVIQYRATRLQGATADIRPRLEESADGKVWTTAVDFAQGSLAASSTLDVIDATNGKYAVSCPLVRLRIEVSVSASSCFLEVWLVGRGKRQAASADLALPRPTEREASRVSIPATFLGSRPSSRSPAVGRRTSHVEPTLVGFGLAGPAVTQSLPWTLGSVAPTDLSEGVHRPVPFFDDLARGGFDRAALRALVEAFIASEGLDASLVSSLVDEIESWLPDVGGYGAGGLDVIDPREPGEAEFGISPDDLPGVDLVRRPSILGRTNEYAPTNEYGHPEPEDPHADHHRDPNQGSEQGARVRGWGSQEYREQQRNPGASGIVPIPPPNPAPTKPPQEGLAPSGKPVEQAPNFDKVRSPPSQWPRPDKSQPGPDGGGPGYAALRSRLLAATRNIPGVTWPAHEQGNPARVRPGSSGGDRGGSGGSGGGASGRRLPVSLTGAPLRSGPSATALAVALTRWARLRAFGPPGSPGGNPGR